MVFFFYGTLMDRELREALLGERARELRVTPGVLMNHRRLVSRHGDYPVLVPALGGRVNGVFVEGMDATALLWISHFEGPTYLPGRAPAQDMIRQRLRPWSFLPTRRSHASDRPWDFRRWQRLGKPRLRDALNSWLLERGRGSEAPLALDAPWAARRRMVEVLNQPDPNPKPNPHLRRREARAAGLDEPDQRVAAAAE